MFFIFPNIEITVTFFVSSYKFLAILKTPPRYCSCLMPLSTNIGSFPDLPKVSQKLYWSIIVSPITRIFKFLKLSIDDLIFSKLVFLDIFLIIFF